MGRKDIVCNYFFFIKYKDKEIWKTAHICLEHRRGVLDSCSSVYSGSLQSSLLSSCHLEIINNFYGCHNFVWKSLIVLRQSAIIFVVILPCGNYQRLSLLSSSCVLESIENYYFCPLVILKLSTIAEIHNKDKKVYILASCQFLKNCIAIGCYSKFRIFLIWIEQGEQYLI